MTENESRIIIEMQGKTVDRNYTIYKEEIISYLLIVLNSLFTDKNSCIEFILSLSETDSKKFFPCLDRLKIISLFNKRQQNEFYSSLPTAFQSQCSTFKKFQLGITDGDKKIGAILKQLSNGQFAQKCSPILKEYDSVKELHAFFQLMDEQGLFKSFAENLNPQSANLIIKKINKNRIAICNDELKKEINYLIEMRNSYTHDYYNMSKAFNCEEDSFIQAGKKLNWQQVCENTYTFFDKLNFCEETQKVFEKLKRTRKYTLDTLKYKPLYLKDYISPEDKPAFIQKIIDLNLLYDQEYDFIFFDENKISNLIEEQKAEVKQTDIISIKELSSLTGFTPTQVIEIARTNKVPLVNDKVKINVNIFSRLANLYRNKNNNFQNITYVSSKLLHHKLQEELKELPVLHTLMGADNVILNDDQKNELFKTHNILIDIRLLLSTLQCKNFRQLLSINENIRNSVLMFDRSSIMFLYKKKDEYERAKNNKSINANELKQLKQYSTAYIFFKDFLYPNLKVKIIGTDNMVTLIDEVDMSFVHTINSFRTQRLAVLTAGAIPWVQNINFFEQPFLKICRFEGLNGDLNNRPDTNKFVEDNTDTSLYVRLKGYLLDKYHYVLQDEEGEIQNNKENVNNVPKQQEIIVSAETIIANDKTNVEKEKVNISQTEKKQQNIVKKNVTFPKKCELKELSHERLNVYKSFELGDTLFDSNGNNVFLTQQNASDSGENAVGGEGTIYSVKNNENIVAKIYHTQKELYTLTKDRYEKIKFMAENQPNIKGVIWPIDLLFNEKHEFVGYTMQKVPSNYISLKLFYTQYDRESVRNAYMKDWDRSTLAVLCQKIATIFRNMHKQGIYMGDVNLGNILVNSNETTPVYFVDSDSYQFDGFACPVGTSEFASPELIKRCADFEKIDYKTILRTESEEDFSIAILLFETIMLVYPYSRLDMPNREAKMNYQFPYATKERDILPATKNYHVMWSNISRELRNNFTDTFQNKKDIKPETYADNFRKFHDIFVKEVTRDKAINQTLYIESKVKNPTLSKTLECPLCHQKFNEPKYIYDNAVKYGREDKEFCPVCHSKIRMYQNIKIQLVCECCNETFLGNKAQQYLKDTIDEDIYCPNCDTFIDVKCENCGKTFPKRKYIYVRDQRLRRETYCNDCRNTIATCDGCGNEFSILRSVYEKLKQEGKFIYCSECDSMEEEYCDNCGQLYETKVGKYKRIKREGKKALCSNCFKKISRRY